VNQLRAAWKYIRSFRSREWQVSDYPVQIQQQVSEGNDSSAPKYRARIINWSMMLGLGNTPEAAMADLQQRLFQFQRKQGYLHRPGKRVPLKFEFAPIEGIEAHAETANRFLTEVLEFHPDDPVFISDESSLTDFDGVLGEGVDLAERVKQVFGVDVSDIENGNLLKIFERIDAQS
jgi:hypothetical protein